MDTLPNDHILIVVKIHYPNDATTVSMSVVDLVWWLLLKDDGTVKTLRWIALVVPVSSLICLIEWRSIV